MFPASFPILPLSGSLAFYLHAVRRYRCHHGSNDRRHLGQRTASQAEISAEIGTIESAYQQAGVEETQPRLDYPPYRSSLLRHPTKVCTTPTRRRSSCGRPCFGERDVHPLEADLTIQHSGEPIGERMVVTGRVVDGDGRPVRRQLVEIWQANAGGRYIHKRDQHPAPLDPNFTGVGPLPDRRRRPLPIHHDQARARTRGRNHHNAWRPAHIHFSLFGTEFTQRMVTQMYFPGDPLFALDPIYQSITDQKARDRLVAALRPRLTSTSGPPATAGTSC